MNPQMRVEIPYTYLPQTEFCHLIRMLKQKSVSTYYVMFSKQHKPRHSNKKYADTRVCQKKICRHTYIRYSINYSPSWGPQRHRNPFSHSLTHSRVPTSTTPLELVTRACSFGYWPIFSNSKFHRQFGLDRWLPAWCWGWSTQHPSQLSLNSTQFPQVYLKEVKQN